ncbi:hypothetical protein LCGC14_1352700, partial [marine sediment metagenome]
YAEDSMHRILSIITNRLKDKFTLKNIRIY